MKKCFFLKKDEIFINVLIKINLFLHIQEKRKDGFHRLETLVVFSSDGDRIKIRKSSYDSFSIDGPFANHLIYNKNDNLIIKARDTFREIYGNYFYPVSIYLTKNLPVSSGLGGGSADAAATLMGLQMLMFKKIEIKDLLDKALNLGSDIPMCLFGFYYQSSLLAKGIGEEINLLPNFPELHCILFNDFEKVKTSLSFSLSKIKKNISVVNGLSDIISFQDLIIILRKTRNDLYESSLLISPNIQKKIKILNEYQSVFSNMSGSGPTCFGIYSSRKTAKEAEKRIRNKYSNNFILSTTTFGKKF